MTGLGGREHRGLEDDRVGAPIDHDVGPGRERDLADPAVAARGDDAQGAGTVGPQGPDEGKAILEVRQVGVDHHDARPEPLDRGQGLGRLARPPDDLDAVGEADEVGEAVADAMVLIDDEDALGRGGDLGRDCEARVGSQGGWECWGSSPVSLRLPANAPMRTAMDAEGGRMSMVGASRHQRAQAGTTTSIVVPLPGCESTLNRPPIRSARARIPARPRCPGGTAPASKPAPSSMTAMPDPVRHATDDQLDGVGRGVLDDVVERLLTDPVEAVLDLVRQPLVELGLDDDRQPDPALDGGRLAPEGGHEPILLESAGPQLEDERAHLRKGVALEVTQGGEPHARRGRVLGEQQLDAPGDQGHAEERLRHRVVELTGQVGTLVARGQLARLAAQVGLEAFPFAQVAHRALGARELAIALDGHARYLGRDRRAIEMAQEDPGTDKVVLALRELAQASLAASKDEGSTTPR